MLKEIAKTVIEEIDFDTIVYNGICGWVEWFLTNKENYKKRREVGFGVKDSIQGAIDETNRKFIAEFKGEEFKESRKAIEFIKK